MNTNGKGPTLAEDASAIEVIEEGIHLLKEAGARGAVLSLIGGGPFALLFIYFWFMMSRSPVAEQLVATMALGLTFSYFWMRFWQARHCLLLWELATGQRPERQSVPALIASTARILFWQGLYIPVQLISLLATITLPWTTGFFHTQLVTAFHGGKKRSFVQLRRIGTAAPSQMGGILLYLTVAWFVLAANFIILLMFVPTFLQGAFGVQNEMARLGGRLLNADTTLTAFVVSALLLSPLTSAVAVIRSFQCESHKTGEDILSQLRRVVRPAATLVAVGLVLMLMAPQPACASEPAPVDERIEAAELQQAIDQAFERPELAWRDTNREFSSQRSVELMNRFYALLDRLFGKYFTKRKSADHEIGFNMNLEPLAWTLVVILVLVVLVAILRAIMKIDKPEEPSQPAPPPPDVNDEAVQADALPPSEWEELAQRLLAQGDYRAALRAYFLAQIATLSTVGLIHFARYKTNLDYHRELKRYAAGNKELATVFDASTLLFEGIWYGGHNVDHEDAVRIGDMTSQLRRFAT